MTLDQFLDRASAEPFVDGKADCALMVADWVMVAMGVPDPAIEFRGKYASAFGRERLLRRLGGLSAVMGRQAAVLGVREASEAISGDVGVIRLGKQTLAGIFTGRLWAVKSSRGVDALMPDDVLIAWRVGHG